MAMEEWKWIDTVLKVLIKLFPQKGFRIVLGLAVAILIGIMLGIGYYRWKDFESSRLTEERLRKELSEQKRYLDESTYSNIVLREEHSKVIARLNDNRDKEYRLNELRNERAMLRDSISKRFRELDALSGDLGEYTLKCEEYRKLGPSITRYGSECQKYEALLRQEQNLKSRIAEQQNTLNGIDQTINQVIVGLR